MRGGGIQESINGIRWFSVKRGDLERAGIFSSDSTIHFEKLVNRPYQETALYSHVMILTWSLDPPDPQSRGPQVPRLEGQPSSRDTVSCLDGDVRNNDP